MLSSIASSGEGRARLSSTRKMSPQQISARPRTISATPRLFIFATAKRIFYLRFDFQDMGKATSRERCFSAPDKDANALSG